MVVATMMMMRGVDELAFGVMQVMGYRCFQAIEVDLS
jgi:hypothetical protein